MRMLLCAGMCVFVVLVGCGGSGMAQNQKLQKRQPPAEKAAPPAQQPPSKKPVKKNPAPPPALTKPKPSLVEDLSPKQLENLQAVIETSMGNITLEFFGQVAPNHVRQFLRLADQGYYNGTTFSRIVKGFVIQGGNAGTWLDTNPNQKVDFATPTLKGEFSVIPHERGTLSMARAGDDENSATTHFFICLGRQSSLDGKYSAFGRVIDGMDVVDAIAAVKIKGGTEEPEDRVEVKTIRVIFPPEK